MATSIPLDVVGDSAGASCTSCNTGRLEASEADARPGLRAPAALAPGGTDVESRGGNGHQAPLGLSGMLRLAKQVAKGAVGAVRTLPEAVGREYEYYTGTRHSANLILTWGCTSKCTACTVWRRPRHKDRELSLDEWVEVARKLAAMGVTTVEFFGGDIFMRKDIVVPLAEEFCSLGVSVHTATNSNLMDPDTAAALVKTLDVVYISTDGTDELHNRIRGVKGTWGRLSRCLRYFLEARGDARLPTLVCNTTVSRHNAHALAGITEFASRAGYDQIDLEYVGEFTKDIVARSRIGDYEPSPIFMQAKGEAALVTRELVPVLREQLRLAKRFERRGGAGEKPFRVNTINVDVLSDRNLVEGTVPGRRCFVDRREIVIDPYGNVVPCYFYDTFSLGNVRDGALERSFENPERARFRAHRDCGDLEMCKHCIHTVVRNHSGADLVRREFTERLRHWRVTPRS